MKRLFYMLSLAAAVMMTSCADNEVDQRYISRAQLSGFWQTYMVFERDVTTVIRTGVPADTPVDFGGVVTSAYAPVEAYLYYQTCSPAKQQELKLKLDNLESDDWIAYWYSDDEEAKQHGWGSESDSEDDPNRGTYARLDSPVSNSELLLTMPGQPAGTVVYMGIEIWTPYLLSYMGKVVYVVSSDEGDEGDEGDNGGSDSDDNADNDDNVGGDVGGAESEE